MKKLTDIKKMFRFSRRITFHIYDLSQEGSLSVGIVRGKTKKQFRIYIGNYIESEKEGKMRIIFVHKKMGVNHVHCVLENRG